MPCRSKSLTVVPRLALTPRLPLLKHSAQYSPPLKRIIMTVTMPRPYKTIVLSRFSSAIAHHALKSPDRLFERNSKRSRKIATATCRAKKLEKCHVKHFPLIITQAFRPSLPRRSCLRQENRHKRRPHPFFDPRLSALFLPPPKAIFFDHNNNFGKPPTKTASILPKYDRIRQSSQNRQCGTLNTKSATTSSTQDISPEAEQNRQLHYKQTLISATNGAKKQSNASTTQKI